MESFFGTLKAEYFHFTDFEDVDALRLGLKGYIDYYNHHRPHGSLGHLTPREFVQKWSVKPKEAIPLQF